MDQHVLQAEEGWSDMRNLANDNMALSADLTEALAALERLLAASEAVPKDQSSEAWFAVGDELQVARYNTRSILAKHGRGAAPTKNQPDQVTASKDGEELHGRGGGE